VSRLAEPPRRSSSASSAPGRGDVLHLRLDEDPFPVYDRVLGARPERADRGTPLVAPRGRHREPLKPPSARDRLLGTRARAAGDRSLRLADFPRTGSAVESDSGRSRSAVSYPWRPLRPRSDAGSGACERLFTRPRSTMIPLRSLISDRKRNGCSCQGAGDLDPLGECSPRRWRSAPRLASTRSRFRSGRSRKPRGIPVDRGWLAKSLAAPEPASLRGRKGSAAW